MHRQLIFLVLLAAIALRADAQTHKADSLKRLLVAADDTGKVNLLNELSRATWYFQLDTAFAYNDQAMQLASKISYPKGLAEANRCRGVIYSFRYDDRGMAYLIKALEIFKQLNNQRGIAATLNNQNEYYVRHNQLAKALEVLFQSQETFTSLGDKEAIGSITNQIGNVYAFQFDYSDALMYYTKALKIRQEIADRPGTAYTLNRIGDMYVKLNQLPEALDYYEQSFKLATSVGRSQNVADAARSIGTVYYKQGKYDDALGYFKISLKAEEDYFGKDNTSESYMYMGETYQAQKHYPFALSSFQKALAIAEKGQYGKLADIYYHIGNLYFEQVNYSMALANCLQSLDLAKKDRNHEAIRDASLVLSKIYGATANYKDAFANHLLYVAAKDSLQVQDLNQRLASLQQSFEVKSRQAQIDLLNRDRQLQQSELNRQKQQRYAYIAGIGLFIILAIVLVRSNRHKQKVNKVLENTLSELKSTQAQLIQSEKMASLGQLTAGIAHEIQNPLNFVNNFSEVNTELIEELKSETRKATNERDTKLENEIINDLAQNLDKINQHGKRADAIVKGMLQHSRMSSVGEQQLVDINGLAEEYLNLSYNGLRAKEKSFNATLLTEFDEGIGKINIVPQDMGRVLLNLYNNAFYAVAEKKKQLPGSYEPTISVSTIKIGTAVRITISDNGNGIPPNVVDKIFQPFFTTKPTGQGTGLGLSLSYDIVKAHGGEITVKSKEGEGTEFVIQLPGLV